MVQVTRYAHNGDVKVAFETFGDASGEPLLLFMGLDFQMVWWPDGFCRLLADRGFYVARFDNRDTGLSTHFDSDRKENALKALVGGTKPAYSGYDMLNDAAAVMDALGWRSAHVAGGSMGAGLAQAMALVHPNRVRSVTSINGLPIDAASGFKSLKYIQWKTFSKFMKIKQAVGRDSEIEMFVEIMRTTNGNGYPFPEEWVREVAGISHDRSPRDPSTIQRQLAASKAAKYPPMSQIEVPVLVIGGLADPLIKTRAARDTAAKIPDSRLLLYPGMGHSFPPELWSEFVKEIAKIADLDGAAAG